ncbi:nuclear transport factor 2 family protein [Amycolatopsis sp. NPDC024027]|uniref:nuclear transport factor 2 family protein n=1 Tax=Amycolatopsis sp. NPDC024027 TaxID=3154327 RepID=UPI00340408B3
MPTDLPPLGEPGKVLEKLRTCAIAQDVEGTAKLYADDVVHDFPFAMPGVPPHLVGRDAVMEFTTSNWNGPIKYERYVTIAAYLTDDPNTIIVHQDVYGSSSTTGELCLPGLIVFTTENGQIKRFTEFVDALAVYKAMGQIKPSDVHQEQEERIRSLTGLS